MSGTSWLRCLCCQSRSARVMWAVVVLSSARGARGEHFDLWGDRLTVRTETLELVLQEGAVVELRDRATGELFSQGTGGGALRAFPTGAGVAADDWRYRQHWYERGPEACAADENFQATRRRPPTGVEPGFELLSPTEAEIHYRTLEGGDEGDRIHYRIAIDTATQEIVLTGSVRLNNPETPPVSLHLVFANLACPAVILGCGTRIEAGMPQRRIDHCVRNANSLHSPLIAVLEGRRGVVSVAIDSVLDEMNISLLHAPDTDDSVVVAAGVNPLFAEGVIRMAPVRVGAHANWVAAARRYRQRFETLTGAKPLWQHVPTWVQNIHAVHTDAPGGVHGNPTVAEARAYYNELAATIDPAALLLFYWNGSGIVAPADHRYMTRLGWPKPNVIKALKANDFRWLGYHHYTLLFPPHQLAKRLDDIEKNNWGLPEGYVFTPDYANSPKGFWDYFRPVSAGYYKPMDEARFWVYHPGSRRGHDHFIRNFAGYCRYHDMDGSYLDICGTVGGNHFPAERKVQEGMTYRQGEARMLHDAREALPQFAFMGEVQSNWSVAETFYTWEGASHITRKHEYRTIDVIVNHPLRTALWGSYCWTREAGIAPHESALMGGLPELVLADAWSIARAQLFAREALFNDLPDAWPAHVLATYRGKDGRWFQFRKLAYGDGYVELSGVPGTTEADDARLRLGRFFGVSESPLPSPVTVPGWQAYRGENPIGLNPARTYPFLLERPDMEGNYTITGLPVGAFVRAFRNDGNAWSTIEFGNSAGGMQPGEITIMFRRDCLRVCDAKGKATGPFAAGTTQTFPTAVPGGIVLVWEESDPRNGHVRNAFLSANGKLDSRGVHDARWSYHSHRRHVTREIGERELAAIEIGPGRHRGYAESWVMLHPQGDPVLRFEVGYPKPTGNRLIRTHRFAISVNGSEIWHEDVEAGRDWLPRGVPLARFNGRTVLLTLSVEELTDQDAVVSHEDAPSLFGNVFVDQNPISFAPLDGVALPRPANVLLVDFSDAKGIGAEWQVFNSPANQEKGLVASVAGGVLVLPGLHYKHQYLSRPGPEANMVIQARLQTPLTGCSREWSVGIGLYWSKGRYAHMTAGGYHDRQTGFAIRGVGRKAITLEQRSMRILDDNCCDCWVRIEAGEKTIRYASSQDGKTWQIEREVARPDDTRSPPLVIVGRGSEGAGDVFRNDLHHNSRTKPSRISDLVVGRLGAGAGRYRSD